MGDQEQASDGNSGFAQEWARLAKEDTDGQASAPHGDNLSENDPLAEAERTGGDAAPPSEAAPPAEAPAPGQEVHDDIWADAPVALRNAYQAERDARARAENTVRANNGRASKAEREAAALRAQFLARQSPAPAGRAASQPVDVSELRARLVGEYDEVNAPVADEVIALRQTVAELVANQASQADIQRAQNEAQLAEYLAGQETRLSEMHSDWGEVVLEPEFVQWVRTGPQFIRDGLARNGNGIVDAEEASRILDLFKADMGRVAFDDPVVAKRRRQLDDNRAIPARTPGATPSGSPDDFKAEWMRLDAIERRQSQSGVRH